ncbi:uncharacterized protein N7473_010291 [Penicillium subrubescens]|uniref:uncharacterized protein n=1 Tax=Penicillium subrubescens TaxID=1316194 RepID=UPI002545669C|nr:uncharacterized protein N7473_010291 [Penicillium subrubescens]KAJ5883405.1 hypothetical protein N7473_010291 [Penicillium subrubescens]
MDIDRLAANAVNIKAKSKSKRDFRRIPKEPRTSKLWASEFPVGRWMIDRSTHLAHLPVPRSPPVLSHFVKQKRLPKFDSRILNSPLIKIQTQYAPYSALACLRYLQGTQGQVS